MTSCYVHKIDRNRGIWSDNARCNRHFSTKNLESTFCGQFFCLESVELKIRIYPSQVCKFYTFWTDEEEDDACALNMLGCLYERAGLLRSSVAMLSRAVDHSPSTHRDKALANFGRVLLKAGKVQDAIEVYRAITKADIHSQCGLALALYKGVFCRILYYFIYLKKYYLNKWGYHKCRPPGHCFIRPNIVLQTTLYCAGSRSYVFSSRVN